MRKGAVSASWRPLSSEDDMRCTIEGEEATQSHGPGATLMLIEG